MTGSVGREDLRGFYSRLFIPRMPPDTEIVPVSRTIGTDRLVDEMVFRFTHTMKMEWMLPGVPPMPAGTDRMARWANDAAPVRVGVHGRRRRNSSAGLPRMPSGVTKSLVPVAETCHASAAGNRTLR